jgi:hypothetical protein
MFLLHVIKTNVVITMRVVLLLVLPLSGLCQPVPVQTEKPSETIEEVIVLGYKSLIDLKHEMYRAEDTLYDLFNSLNTDDLFDVRCYKEVPTGSKIPWRVCRTNWFRDRYSAETQMMMRGEPFMYPVFRNKKMDDRLNELMSKAIREQPKMLDTLARYAEAKQTLESEHEIRCGGRFLICRSQ